MRFFAPPFLFRYFLPKHAEDRDRVAFTFAFTWRWVRAEKWPSSILKYMTELFEANENDKFMCRMREWKTTSLGAHTIEAKIPCDKRRARDTTISNYIHIWCNNSWMILCVTEKRISEINRDVCEDCELWRRNKLNRSTIIRNENHSCVCVCCVKCPLASAIHSLWIRTMEDICDLFTAIDSNNKSKL